MPAILVLSSVKHIATQILVIAKLNGNFQQNITCSKLATDKKRCENYLLLRIKALEQLHSGAFIFNYECISFFVLIADFERTNVCWVHIEKANTFEDKIGYIMGYFAVF